VFESTAREAKREIEIPAHSQEEVSLGREEEARQTEQQRTSQASLVRQRFMASSDYDNLDDLTQSAEVSIYLIIILTLALVLLIEGLRRKLDALAHGHQFFQTVLELIYREVTTLGIVEFCLYLVHKYSDAYGSQTEGEISGGVEDCHNLFSFTNLCTIFSQPQRHL